MKYRLREGKNDLSIYNEDFADMESEIDKAVRKMSRYASHQKPVLALGSWPGIALWKVKVTFATGVEMDLSFKTERVKE